MSISESLTNQMTEARKYGALFHITNPQDSWFCTECSVFGRGETSCWMCNGPVQFGWVPHLGGGAQNASSATTDNVV